LVVGRSLVALTGTSLARSAATVTYGREQAEHLTVTVVSRHGGTPAGTVTVKAGTATVCLVKLRSGRGSCTLTARQLKVGTYHLVARWPGSADFAPSASPTETLKVAK
jgi:Bacterial Ig-like domain (group 3)